MQTQPTGDGESPIEHEHARDSLVLAKLLIENEGPWTADELVLGFGGSDERVWVMDSLDRLRRGGLVRRTDEGLLFPTRAAIYADQLFSHS